MKIVWTEPARQDLRQVFEYIAEDSPKAAGKLLLVIKKRAVLLQGNLASWAEGSRQRNAGISDYRCPVHLAVSCSCLRRDKPLKL